MPSSTGSEQIQLIDAGREDRAPRGRLEVDQLRAALVGVDALRQQPRAWRARARSSCRSRGPRRHPGCARRATPRRTGRRPPARCPRTTSGRRRAPGTGPPVPMPVSVVRDAQQVRLVLDRRRAEPAGRRASPARPRRSARSATSERSRVAVDHGRTVRDELHLAVEAVAAQVDQLAAALEDPRLDARQYMSRVQYSGCWSSTRTL